MYAFAILIVIVEVLFLNNRLVLVTTWFLEIALHMMLTCVCVFMCLSEAINNCSNEMKLYLIIKTFQSVHMGPCNAC